MFGISPRVKVCVLVPSIVPGKLASEANSLYNSSKSYWEGCKMASKKGKKNLKKYDGIIGRRADGEAVTRPFRGRTVAEAKQQYHTYLTEH